MSLREDLKSQNKFVFTAELNPPRGSSTEALLANAQKISGLVSAINITDNSGASSKMCSLVASAVIHAKLGLETIWQVTCRDRNRLALQSDLYGAWALGLKSILPLKGDMPQGALSAEKCFDLNTEDLIGMISSLKSMKDFEGKEISGSEKIDFCIGSAAHPGVPDLKTQTETMLRRIDQGVEFFQTQICYDPEQISRFVDAIGTELASKTILGLTPLKSVKQAHFMNDKIFGVTVPLSQISALDSARAEHDEDSDLGKSLMQEEGLRQTKILLDFIKSTPLKGVHIMAIGQESKLDQIINSLC